jgi:hypothetical protein
LPTTAFSQLTAEDLKTPELNWDGEKVEEEEEKIIEFSIISMLLVGMIFLVCIFVTFINRIKLLARIRFKPKP